MFCKGDVNKVWNVNTDNGVIFGFVFFKHTQNKVTKQK